jgi:hypothetical protein
LLISKLTRGAFFLAFLVSSGCLVGVSVYSGGTLSSLDQTTAVSIVQKEIRVGTTQTDVETISGSPDIVTKDSEGRETWTYNRIATRALYSRTEGEGGKIDTLILDVDTRRLSGVISASITFGLKGTVESFEYK